MRDAMLTCATLALAGGASLIQAAYLGNAASAIELGLLGNVPVAHDQLACWLHGRGELADARSAVPSRSP
jgi:bifunctional ADP-heptose synthase (sugar kinase/adenylyltransferase)